MRNKGSLKELEIQYLNLGYFQKVLTTTPMALNQPMDSFTRKAAF